MSDRYCTLRVSKDGGYNWGELRQASLGEVGDFGYPVIWRRFGACREMVAEISISSNMPATLIAMQILDSREG